MTNLSIIQKSQLEGANRIDAEYYQLEYLEKITKLMSTPTVRLGDIAYITDGEHGSPIWDENSGIKYYSAQHVRDGIIDSTDAQTISKVIDDKNKRSRLQKGDILISTVGTIGFAGLVTEKILPANIDRHVGRICLKPNTLDPEFLVAFLNSSYGRFQSFRNSTGNVQLNLFIEKIKEFLIPKNNNSQVSQLVKLFLQEKDIFEKLYVQAENLLLEELGLKDYKAEDNLSFVVNFFDVKNYHRLDSDYFQPKYQKLFSIIKTNNPKLLGEIAIVKKGFEPGSEAYQEDGKKFIRVSNLTKLGFDDGDQKYISDDLYNELKTNFEPKEGEILLTKDATPGISYLIKEPFEGIISGGILRLKTKTDVNLEYISLVINSIVGQWQAQRDAGGAIIVHWRPEQIKNMMIPILSKETQQKIADLVNQSHKARKKSKDLLEEAKRKVEEMVEKGSEN